MGWVSDHVIEAMGFNKMADGEMITAVFHSLHVFQAQGINVDIKTCEKRVGRVGDVDFEIAFGASVNELSQKLLAGDFVDDESEWTSEKKGHPPYFMIHFGPTAEFSASPRYVQRIGEDVHTYDAFSDAKLALRTNKILSLPVILTGLNCAFSRPSERMARLRLIDEAVFGVTSSGETLHDVRLNIAANISTSSRIDQNEITRSLERLPIIIEKSGAKSINLFNEAMFEDDRLKKFLFYFLSIEILTHEIFDSINHEQRMSEFSQTFPVSWMNQATFFADVGNWRNLRDRFLWCAYCKWPHLEESDIESFKILKKIRDGIAHGRITLPNEGQVRAIEELAVKLHSFDSHSN